MAEAGLENLKENYEKLRKKYKLPNFQQLNEDFDVERIAEKETDFLLREIRKVMVDKALSYLRFFEYWINPSSAPMFILSLSKTLSSGTMKTIDSLYKELVEVELEVIGIDNIYSEKKEAVFIIKLAKEWKSVKENVADIAKTLKTAWKQKAGKKERSYFG